jgi:hypothetical protein
VKHVSDAVLRAACDVIGWAMIHCRNWTLRENTPYRQINELMEATHAIPEMIWQWEDEGWDEEKLVSEIRLHLSGFDPKKWDDALDLVARFDDALQRHRRLGGDRMSQGDSNGTPD